ncbi:Multiple antibiotic resistance protein marR [Corynebacterium kutscheri]|uniref:Transcriptional regulator n=1 Tax=Corynebacterium kutscheri TaxID=35755 RepID=A0A0F6TEI4_9CORY|nr:MarR family transcriptional regulator [Corynebacterium kutscheri]AKE42196.1 transcriptional regulator [Corynebacterium kutscheri]VEH10539.1 Multiple antibiotic resistance protein marR [Corynebacterium kutscheri]VEH81677.1 Multiple antibiotic resistance protein marR [Corynebacterium kutscheri]
MPNKTPLEIAAEIRPALTKLYVLYFRIAEQSDLTGPQLTIMTSLKEHGPSRISYIAQTEGIRMPTASNALHQLEIRGLVERIRDQEDRRGVKVQLTTLGFSELKRVGDERTQYLAQMLDSLPADQLDRVEEFSDVVKTLAQTYPRILEEHEDGF